MFGKNRSHPANKWTLDFRETPRKPREPSPEERERDEAEKARWLKDHPVKKLPSRGNPNG